MKRLDKINYYLDIAETVALRSTCLRKLYGCVIVKNDEIVSTGYSGAPRGRPNCSDLGKCAKKDLFPDVRHAGYDACRSVHSEQNAIISASRERMIGSTLYLVGIRADDHNVYEEGAKPCLMCERFIINAGIEKVIVRKSKTEYEIIYVEDLIKHDPILEGRLSY